MLINLYNLYNIVPNNQDIMIAQVAWSKAKYRIESEKVKKKQKCDTTAVDIYYYIR